MRCNIQQHIPRITLVTNRAEKEKSKTQQDQEQVKGKPAIQNLKRM